MSVSSGRIHRSQRGTFSLARWGLIPSWAADASIGYRTINARCETVASKAAFREAFARRRWLLPADGFYEWRQSEKERQPFYCRMQGDFAICARRFVGPREDTHAAHARCFPLDTTLMWIRDSLSTVSVDCPCPSCYLAFSDKLVSVACIN
jgi:hypothetical protein